MMPEASEQSGIAVREAVRALERFVVDNDELLELEAQIGRFNVFDALGIVRAEIRHSAFLRWLLDPNESHGLGAMFLRPVLMDMLRNTPDEKRPLSPVDLDGVEFRGVEVSAERERIDILVTSDDPPLVLAIENKVDSGEHSGQLARYRETVQRLFPGREALFVYLTREGDEPSDEAWTPYSYRDVHRVMERVERTNEGSIGDDVRVFLDHYLSLLRSRFMDDPVIDALVEKIYRQHKPAVDLIIERKGDPRTSLVRVFAERLTELGDYTPLWNSKASCGFSPDRWASTLPPIGGFPSFAGTPLCYVGFKAVHSNSLMYGRVGKPTHTDFAETLLQAAENAPKECGLKPGQFTKKGVANLFRSNVLKHPEGAVDDEETVKKVREAAERMHGLCEAIAAFFEQNAEAWRSKHGL